MRASLPSFRGARLLIPRGCNLHDASTSTQSTLALKAPMLCLQAVSQEAKHCLAAHQHRCSHIHGTLFACSVLQLTTLMTACLSVRALLLLWSVHSLAPGLCVSRLILQLALLAPEDATLVHVSILSSSAKRSKITCNATQAERKSRRPGTQQRCRQALSDARSGGMNLLLAQANSRL